MSLTQKELSVRVRGVRCGTRALRVLIVSATVGAGDAGNARELARRLTDAGHEADVRDFLETPPLGIGKALSKGYEAELRHAPWAYELAFKVWFWFPFLLVPLARFLTFFTQRRTLQWVRETHADIVVSTYPVATQVLGELRSRANKRWRNHAALRVPVVNFITDFGFHPFWAHRGIDLNLAVPPGTVEAVGRRTGRASHACGPLVGPEFLAAPARRDFARARLGLRPEELAVLISSGSWGVGALKEAFELVANQPGLVPVVTCGRNSDLRDHLEAVAKDKGYRAHLLGWTDDMAGVMAACDVLVENAGGLTSLEAMGAGLPLVTFRPIPGHGRNSAVAMSSAGVSCLARNGQELVEDLGQLGRPAGQSGAISRGGQPFFGRCRRGGDRNCGLRSATGTALAAGGAGCSSRIRSRTGRRHLLGGADGWCRGGRGRRHRRRPSARRDREHRLPGRKAELPGATQP